MNKVEPLYYKHEIIGDVDVYLGKVNLIEPEKWTFISNRVVFTIKTEMYSHLNGNQLHPYAIKHEIVGDIDIIISEYNHKQNNCNHRYSKAMGQSWPRLCVACNKPEPIN